MKKNKGQTISILLSIVLSVAMMVSVSCLMYSSHVNKTESVRAQYGDYHYYLLGNKELYQNIIERQSISEYDIQNIQMVEIKDSINVTDNLNVVLSFANPKCRSMINREIIEGKYPDNSTEIALDRYTLRLLGEDDVIGSEIEIGALESNGELINCVIDGNIERMVNTV